jgi:hypothetical protein
MPQPAQAQSSGEQKGTQLLSMDALFKQEGSHPGSEVPQGEDSML